MPRTMLPLDGLVVADFSRVLAGPLATTALADLGARVIKVERPGVGDDTRAWGPPWTQTSSAYFECANRTKESVTLDLRDAADLELARELARRADVLVENFRVGTLDRLGLGYPAVSQENPGIIYCSVSGFGSGAGAALPGYDFIVQAMGGLMSITGDRDGEPTKAGVALVDVLTGKDAVIGILAALTERSRSGRGQHVEVNLLSSLLGSLANQTMNYLTTGASPGRMGNEHPSIAPYETIRCGSALPDDQHGLVAIACGNDGQFARLAVALGLADMASDDRFATNSARVTHRPEMRARLEGALAAYTPAAARDLIAGADVPVGLVGDIGSAIEAARDLGLEPTMPVGDGHPDQIRHPISYSRSGTRAPIAPPSLGEHDADVRAWLTQAPI